MGFSTLLLGRRLANREAEHRRIGTFEGVPAMGLDALGSTAYGPEAALTLLAPLGAAGLGCFAGITLPILVLLALLYASYLQTIRAYPKRGGAYVVARENIGTGAGLLAAAALMIDLVLNVAVGISAGVAALVSAVPALHAHTPALCLAVLALITVANLRGTIESGRLFALPVYTFVVAFAVILGTGVVRSVAAGGAPLPVVAPPAPGAAAETLGAWLLLRALAAGCTAMTGVEAVSNGIDAFREPTVRYGARTLSVLVGTLGAFLAAIAWLVPAYGVVAMDEDRPGYRSVLAQLAGAIVGQGWLYYTALGALLCVLVLSANTSFVAFPHLCRTLAQDGFLPKSFAVAGRRLVFSIGLLTLALAAGLLLAAFDGITNRLIPLFAIGAFLSFTLSQASMVLHWRRLPPERAPPRRGLLIAVSGVGAAATLLVLLVIAATKFADGAWMSLLAIGALLVVFRAVHRYYARVERRTGGLQPLAVAAPEPPIVVVAIEELNRLGIRGIEFGLSLTSDVIAMHLTQLDGPDAEERELALRRHWETLVARPARAAGLTPPRLLVLPAARRTMHEPMLRLVRKIQTERPQRRIAVLIPELVKRHWYQQVLHTHRARRLRSRLLRHGDPRVTVVSVPWRVDA